MKVNDKLEIRNRLMKKGVKLTHEQTTTIANFFDEVNWREKKAFQESKIGTRLIYTVIFCIMVTHSWFHATWQSTLILGIILLYNMIHFLQNYVFYHNNFRVNPYEQKD